MPETKQFILASGSPQRLALLKQMGLLPEKIESANIDETPHRFETPSLYVKRMALEKAAYVAAHHPNNIVLGGDTIVVAGRRIIQKAKNENEQKQVMSLLSGRANHVLSAVCVIDKTGKSAIRISKSRLVVKKLSKEEIEHYVQSREWVGCAGFRIEGIMESYIVKMIGSYSGIVGLPLYETKCLLNGVGIK